MVPGTRSRVPLARGAIVGAPVPQASGVALDRADNQMRYLALLVAFFIVCVGVTGIFMPDSLMAVGRYVVTTNGLYAVAALRVGIGLVLMFAARISRAPRTLRTLGAVVCVAGLATPFFGVDRARAVLDWEATQGTALIRLGAVLAVLGGGFIAYAVAADRRPVS
jgi:hypothetical protein